MNAIYENAFNNTISEEISHLLISFMRDISFLAVSSVENKICTVDPDAALQIVIKYVFNHVVLRDAFVKKQKMELIKMFYRTYYYDRPDFSEDQSLDDLYWNLKDINDLQDLSWNALSTQEPIHGWSEGLDGLKNILDSMVDVLQALGGLYARFDDIADKIELFKAALDAVEIIPRSIELGVLISALYSLGGETSKFANICMPYLKGHKERIVLGPEDLNFGIVEKNKRGIPRNVWLVNLWSYPVIISRIQLSDEINFELLNPPEQMHLPPHGVLEIPVVFSPKSDGVFVCTVEVVLGGGGERMETNLITLTGATNGCHLPSGPVLKAIQDGASITLKWTKVPCATGYRLFYAPYPDASYINQIDLGDLNFLTGLLPPGSAYYIAIQPYGKVGDGTLSNIEAFTIPEELRPVGF